MKTLGLSVLVVSTLLVVILVGIASDLFGPLGKTLLIIAVVLMFTVMGFGFTGGSPAVATVFSRREGEATKNSLKGVLSELSVGAE